MDILTYIDRVKANYSKQPEPVYNTQKYFTGGRVGFENGKKVRTPEEIRIKKNQNKLNYDRKNALDIEYRKKKTEENKINLIENAKRTFAENPGLKEAHINNLYRKENGKFIRRYEPLRPFAEVFADFGITPSMAKEFSSIIRKELKADGSLGTAEGSDVKRNKSIQEGKANAGPTSEPLNKDLKYLKKSENSKLINLLKEDSDKLVSSIRSNPDLMDQLESVFDGEKVEIKKVKISDDEIKKLVNNGLYSEEHTTPVKTGKKNIEFPTNKGFVTKQANSKVFGPMNMWLNTGNNYKLVDGEVKDPKLKNLENWLTKNRIRTKVEGAKGYFGDKSLESIPAKEAHKIQFNLLKPKYPKGLNFLGKGLKAASTASKIPLELLSAGAGPIGLSVGALLESGFAMDELTKGNLKEAGRQTIFGLLPESVVGSKQNDLLQLAETEEEKVSMQNFIDYKNDIDKYGKLLKRYNYLEQAPGFETEGVDLPFLKKRLDNLAKDLTTREPKIQNREVQNIVTTLTKRLDQKNVKNLKGPLGTIMGRRGINDRKDIIEAADQSMYEDEIPSMYDMKKIPATYKSTTSEQSDIYDMGRQGAASGGIANLTRTTAPKKGPQSEGLAYFMKNGKK